MKIKNEKKALQMFCNENEEIREDFRHPFVSEKDGGLIYATDGNALLKVDPKLVRGKYPISQIHLSDDWTENRDIVINLDKIEEARKEVVMVEEEVESVSSDYCTCPDCDGYGRVDYYYKNYRGEVFFQSHTCPTCSGEGHIGKKEVKKTGRMIIPKDALFEMRDAYFTVTNLLRAVDALRLMGYNKMRWISKDENFRNVFQVDDGIRLYLIEYFISKEKGAEDKNITIIDL